MTTNKVAQSEFELLSLAQGLFVADKSRLMESLFCEPHKLPKLYSPLALSLLQDSLSKGIIVSLARQGCLNHQSDRQAGVSSSYWWNRIPVQELRFSHQSVKILRWMLKTELKSNKSHGGFNRSAIELGDELLMFFVSAKLIDFQCHHALEKSIAFVHSALCWLGYFDYFAKKSLITDKEINQLNFESLVTDYAWAFETLQKPLLKRWLTIEANKSTIVDPEYMIRLGNIQSLLLNRLLTVAEKHKRLDLLLFVFQAGGTILQNNPTPNNWVKSLSQDVPLRLYTKATKASMALFNTIETRYQVIQDLKAVRFFDDDYAYSQQVLKHWEWYGEQGLEAAKNLVSELTAINQATIT